MENAAARIQIFTTCPPYRGGPSADYLAHVRRVSAWSDAAGCDGMLVYTDNSTLDPWLLSQIVIQNTRSLTPLVAVQPIYMHPYAVANAVSTLNHLSDRRICLNMVAGGFKNDLTALNDLTPHERRYDRLVEYTAIIQRLLRGGAPVTFSGQFYTVHQLSLKPPPIPELFPIITISGSSPEGRAAAATLGAIPVEYPEPAAELAETSQDKPLSGIRVGIIARDDADAAWDCAHERFPPDRAGKIAHELAMKVSDSVWHKQLSDIAQKKTGARDTYWLGPFETYKTFCPYLVGTYADVAAEIRKYMRKGSRLFILDVPRAEEDLEHIRTVFDLAAEGSAYVAATHS